LVFSISIRVRTLARAKRAAVEENEVFKFWQEGREEKSC
jgi:hypothetical protein